ncbi:unnamed protein product [Onchocerca ochengi]|uniref:Reverse transcriptase domain-containing protein n=1 Tax=Onchocerca ochengi TaxID=42157 RepID=A0A182ERL0_ONCOC|nr:unnamed protein product [Onchocerca ochengi]
MKSYWKQPEILIGVEHFSKFIKLDKAQELESGFLLLQTKLGPMLAENGYMNNIRNRNAISVEKIVICAASATSHDCFGSWSLLVLRSGRTKNNEEIPQRYDETIRNQLRTEVIEEVSLEMNQKGIIHYLPHHEIISSNKPATKFRILHDPSAHLKGAKSLNEVSYRRSVMPPDLIGIVVGNAHHLETNRSQIELEIGRNLYVDNVTLLANGTREALDKYHEVKTIFKEAAMNICEFLSNDDNSNKAIPEHDRLEGTPAKILGITWINNKDTIRVKLRPWIGQEPTKRSVFSICRFAI